MNGYNISYVSVAVLAQINTTLLHSKHPNSHPIPNANWDKQQSHKHLLSESKPQKPSTAVHQTNLKVISPSTSHRRYQRQNLSTSPVLSDPKEEKSELYNILAEITCPESPVTAISTPEKIHLLVLSRITVHLPKRH